MSGLPPLVSDNGLAKAAIISDILTQGLFAIDVSVDLQDVSLTHRYAQVVQLFKIDTNFCLKIKIEFLGISVYLKINCFASFIFLENRVS